MGKLSKRFLSLLVAAVMVLSMLPASVFATEAETGTGAEQAVTDTTAQNAPDATVSVLKPVTLTEAEHDYMCWPNGDVTIDRPLQIVMNFKANETLEECLAGNYSEYLVDFYLQVDGLANGTITTNGCYLAGNYGSFGWIVIPADGIEMKEDIRYPIVSAYDATLNYKDICGSVKDFTAAIYISDAILNENPDFKVTLELRMTNPDDSSDVIVVGTPATYTVADLKAGLEYLEEYDEAKNVINTNTQVGGEVDVAGNANAIAAAKEELKKLNSNLTDVELAGLTPSINVSFLNMVMGSKTAPDKVSFDVTPTMGISNTIVEISSFDAPVTFRLPIHSAETRQSAKVYHEDELMGIYPIQVVNGEKFVEISSASFSTYTVEPTDGSVAAIGDTYYESLQAAISAAKAGDTVTLLANVELTDTLTIAAGKTVTLDLAGYTISQTKEQTAAYQMILNDGNLTIKDSVGDGKISYTDSGNGGNYISDTIYNRGVLVINGGTIENLSSDTVAANGYPHAVDTYSGIRDTSVTINGGTIYCAEYSAIRMFCVSATNKADLVINDGTIKGAIDMQNGSSAAALGSLTINGGTFVTTANANNIRFANWNGSATTYGITAEIKGGSFNGGISTAYVPAAANWNSKIISGGTFSSAVAEKYCAEGYIPAYDETTGTYGVVVDPAYGKVAKIGDTYYATLADAVAAVKENGGTLTLLADANESITFNYPAEGAPTEITLDLNGFTITSAESTLWVSDGYSVTVKDSAGSGKIISTNTNGEAIAIARGGKVTLESGYVYNTAYAVYLYSGNATGEETFVMNGGHVVVDNDGTAIAVGAGSAVISGGTVEVKKTSGGWAMYIYDNGSATISGGTIVGVPGGNNLTISGGTFKLVTDSDVLRNDKLAAACMFRDNGDGTYNVVNLNGYALVGSGTESDPYVLSTKEDLFAFAVQYNSKLIARTVYVELGADIDLNDEEWTPIGDREADQGSFLGVFDGKGHTISNLWISEYTKTGAGFFSKVGNQTEHVSGTVKNVTFNNVTIISDKSYVGVIAQAPLGALIENVHITGDVAIQGYGYVGGIVGHGYPTINDCSVKAEGQIIANYWGAGAILGFSGDNGAKVTNSTVVGTGEEGLEIHGNYGGAASVTGSPYGAAVNGATVSDVKVTSNSDYCMGYVTAGGTLQGEIVVENVTAEANGVAVAPDQIAKIGDVIYTELADAIAAAKDGDTITLLADVTLSETVVIDKKVTIEGEGKKIIAGSDVLIALRVNAGGDLTLGEGLTVEAANCAVFVRDGKLTTSANLTVTGELGAIQTNGSATADVTVNGGNLTAPDTTATIYWPSTGKLTINGGTITGGTAVYMKSGALEITGGKLVATGAKSDYVYDGNGCSATGAALVIENVGGSTGYEEITSVSITGGTFESANSAAVASYTAGNEGVEAKTGFISGGTFSSDVSDLCAEGYKAAQNEDGTYGVEEKPEEKADKLTALSTSLKGNIGFKIYYSLTEETLADSGAYVIFKIDGEEIGRQLVSDAVGPDADGDYAFECEIAAAQMTKKVSIQMVYGDGTLGTEYKYSVRDYAVKRLNNPNAPESVKELLRAMLNYGAYAQILFEYNDGDLANVDIEGLPSMDNITVDSISQSNVHTGAATGIAIDGYSALLESETTFKFSFALETGASIEDYTFTYVNDEGKTVELEPKLDVDGCYCVYIEDIPAAYLDKMYTITVTNDNDNTSYSLESSVLCYAKSVLKNTKNTEAKINLAKALYLYSLAANTYFGE